MLTSTGGIISSRAGNNERAAGVVRKIAGSNGGIQLSKNGCLKGSGDLLTPVVNLHRDRAIRVYTFVQPFNFALQAFALLGISHK